ncbi:MAG: NeuD/PglB/VioB family sugar acetyltransferase [Acidobacteriota bacterium]
MTRVAILGAGTFAVELLEAIELGGVYEPVGFVVSEESFLARPRHCGLPVVTAAQMPWAAADTLAIAGIVSTTRRGFIDAIRARGFRFATVCHPSATISPRATIGAGTFVGAGVIIASQTQVQEHVVINRGANVGHDVTIESFTTVGPGATMAGGVVIESGAYVGIGAVVRDHVRIGSGALVAAGALVVKSVPSRVMVIGAPARVVKEGVDGL